MTRPDYPTATACPAWMTVDNCERLLAACELVLDRWGNHDFGPDRGPEVIAAVREAVVRCKGDVQ